MKILKIIIKAIIITLVIFYWTIARHEGSHALMASLEGADIQELRLLPGIHKDAGFYFGYVEYSEDTSWLTEAASFFSDFLLLLITSLILLWKPGIKYFKEILLLGFISPIIDLIYNYQGGLWRPGTDVYDLLTLLPRAVVHFSYILTIVIAILLLLFFRSRRLKTSPKKVPAD
jgi:hypothetical protein